MNSQDNVFYRTLDIFANFVLLNLLWIIFSLPIITLFPATTALFGVANKWIHTGIQPGLLSDFLQLFKQHFRKSFFLGLLWGAAFVLLSLNLVILLISDFTGMLFICLLWLFITSIFICISLYLFPIIVHHPTTVIQSITLAWVYSLTHLAHTILSIAVLLIACILLYYFPFLLIIVGSLIAFILSYIYQHATKDEKCLAPEQF